MEAKKILGKQIVIEAFFILIIAGVILIGGYTLFKNLKNKDVYSSNDLVVDISSNNVSSMLFSMSDSSGLKSNPYTITITNNSKKDKEYEIYLKPKFSSSIDYKPYLKVSIDDITINTLNSFKVVNKEHYIIYKDELSPGVTATHMVKVWLSVNAPNELTGTKCDFEIGIEE